MPCRKIGSFVHSRFFSPPILSYKALKVGESYSVKDLLYQAAALTQFLFLMYPSYSQRSFLPRNKLHVARLLLQYAVPEINIGGILSFPDPPPFLFHPPFFTPSELQNRDRSSLPQSLIFHVCKESLFKLESLLDIDWSNETQKKAVIQRLFPSAPSYQTFCKDHPEVSLTANEYSLLVSFYEQNGFFEKKGCIGSYHVKDLSVQLLVSLYDLKRIAVFLLTLLLNDMQEMLRHLFLPPNAGSTPQLQSVRSASAPKIFPRQVFHFLFELVVLYYLATFDKPLPASSASSSPSPLVSSSSSCGSRICLSKRETYQLLKRLRTMLNQSEFKRLFSQLGDQFQASTPLTVQSSFSFLRELLLYKSLFTQLDLISWNNGKLLIHLDVLSLFIKQIARFGTLSALVLSLFQHSLFLPFETFCALTQATDITLIGDNELSNVRTAVYDSISATQHRLKISVPNTLLEEDMETKRVLRNLVLNKRYIHTLFYFLPLSQNNAVQSEHQAIIALDQTGFAFAKMVLSYRIHFPTIAIVDSKTILISPLKQDGYATMRYLILSTSSGLIKIIEEQFNRVWNSSKYYETVHEMFEEIMENRCLDNPLILTLETELGLIDLKILTSQRQLTKLGKFILEHRTY